MLIGALIMMFVTSAKLSALIFIAIPIIVLPLVGFGRSCAPPIAPRSGYAWLTPRPTRQKISPRIGRCRPTSARRLFRAGSAAPSSAPSGRRVERMKARAGVDRSCHIPDGRQRRRRSLVWRIRRYRRRDDRRSPQPVRSLRAVRGGRAGRALRGLGRNQPGRRRGRAAVRDDGDACPKSARPSTRVPLPQPALGTIAFENVTFNYPARPDVAALDAVSFRVSAGETVAHCRAVGRRQEHHLQFASALLRPRRRHGARRRRQRRRGRSCSSCAGAWPLVPQDVALFDDTVAENIRYGTPGATLSRGSPRRDGRAGRRVHSGAGPTATTASSASAAYDIVGRPASAHCDCPRHFARTRPSCCSTRRRARSMPKARALCNRRLTD